MLERDQVTAESGLLYDQLLNDCGVAPDRFEAIAQLAEWAIR